MIVLISAISAAAHRARPAPGFAVAIRPPASMRVFSDRDLASKIRKSTQAHGVSMPITRAPLHMPGPGRRRGRCRSRRPGPDALSRSRSTGHRVPDVPDHHAVDGHDVDHRALGEQSRPSQRAGAGQLLGGSFLAYPPFLVVYDALGVLDHCDVRGFSGVHGSSLATSETGVSEQRALRVEAISAWTARTVASLIADREGSYRG